MTVEKRGTRLRIAVALVAGAVLAVWVYRELTWTEMDLSRLEELSATEGYAALIARLHASDPGSEGFSFVALGDTRSNFEKATEVLTRVAQEEPAFILSNGDLGRDGTVEEYLEYHLPLIEQIDPIPFIAAPGNHEKGPNRDFAPFKALFGDERFSFDYGGCRFVGFNNGDRPKTGPLDLRYLKQELSKPGAKHKFVILHQPPEFLEEAVHSEDKRGFAWNSRPFHRIMQEYEVDHVFAGHVHGFATSVIDGVRYTITGGGGVGLTDTLGEDAQVHHFILVHVSPEGVRNEVIKLVDGAWVAEAFRAAAD